MMNMKEPAFWVELQKLNDSPFSFLPRDEEAGLSMFEDSDHLYIEAPVPGVKPDQIHINVDKGIVWIQAEEIKNETKARKVHYCSERKFSYRIPLPMRIDERSLPEAVCENGMIKLTLPKSQSCKPIKISVKPASG